MEGLLARVTKQQLSSVPADPAEVDVWLARLTLRRLVQHLAWEADTERVTSWVPRESRLATHHRLGHPHHVGQLLR